MTLAIDLELIDHGREQTNFATKLLLLIGKADLHNRELLRKGFPNAVKVFEHWQETGEFLDLEYD